MKILGLIIIVFSCFYSIGQPIRLRAEYLKGNNGVTKYEEESNKLLVVNFEKMNLIIYGNPNERFDFYDSFEIDDATTMLPALDKDGVEFAIELYLVEKYIYVTIQNATENKFGEFDSRMYICTVIE